MNYPDGWSDKQFSVALEVLKLMKTKNAQKLLTSLLETLSLIYLFICLFCCCIWTVKLFLKLP